MSSSGTCVAGGDQPTILKWRYRKAFSGTLTGLSQFAGSWIFIIPKGPAFQAGSGANGKNTNDEALEFILDLPAGIERDDLVIHAAKQWAMKEPASAASWAELIDDAEPSHPCPREHRQRLVGDRPRSRRQLRDRRDSTRPRPIEGCHRDSPALGCR